jgi:hypothetical protein
MDNIVRMEVNHTQGYMVKLLDVMYQIHQHLK